MVHKLSKILQNIFLTGENWWTWILVDNSYLIMFLDLNQYTVKSKRLSILRSPEIFQRKACFTFQYFVSFDSKSKDSRVLVFIRNASNSELFPSRIEKVYYKRGSWHTIKILILKVILIGWVVFLLKFYLSLIQVFDFLWLLPVKKASLVWLDFLFW
jgi:hypothetical protein